MTAALAAQRCSVCKTPLEAGTCDRHGYMVLTDADRQVLTFAGLRFKHEGIRDRRIKVELGMRPIQFELRVKQLAGTRAGRAEFPTVCRIVDSILDERKGGDVDGSADPTSAA